MSVTVHTVVDHIVNGTTNSPFLSLTASYGVAECYAKVGSAMIANPQSPGIVYEVEIDNPLPVGVQLLDPIKFLIQHLNDPPDSIPYHHNGDQRLLLGVVDPNIYNCFSPVPVPRGNAGKGSTPPIITNELMCIVRAVRDAEILAVGNIPKAHVVAVHPVY